MRIVRPIGWTRRRGFGLSVALGIGLTVIIIWVLSQYPRQSLLSDVRQSKRIIVGWRLLEKNETYSLHFFELDESSRPEFLRTLKGHLGLDYFRGCATVAPTINVYVVDDAGSVSAGYGIRRDQNGGPCPSMESLRNIASKGRPLSEKERAEILNEKVEAKFPHILPWPECRYDFVLPSTAEDAKKSTTPSA